MLSFNLQFYLKKDESSIQGSIELKKIITPIEQIENFRSCFEVLTSDGMQNSIVCCEDENNAREWIVAITQNIVNCN